MVAKRKPPALVLREFALALPGAHEDFPWGDRVAKVRGKVFVFLGRDAGPGQDLSLSVKLPHSAASVLEESFAEPTGYGLGRAGWVTLRFGPRDEVPVESLLRWIEESYRAVAPKKLVAELAARE
jgi:predicted DNA-binding protein (MmcQ/YjbR family)